MASSLHAFRLSSSLPSSYLSYHQRVRICASLKTPADEKPSCASLPEFTATTIVNNGTDEAMRLVRKDERIVAKLYAIAEAASDRSEMHKILGEQRNNWNHLLLHSINSITLTASVTTGISSMLESTSPHLHVAFKICSALLFASSAALMAVTNKIQPSQLAEEQRNAARLFRQLEKSIHNSLSLRIPAENDAEEAMERVLTLDEAYPLPLFPGMLDKFPKEVEPTRWWPKIKQSDSSARLREDVRAIVETVRRRDVERYVSFGKLVLRINKILAVSGPMLAGVAAIGASLAGAGSLGPLPALVGAVGGAAATLVNTLQHGGQIGMVFELSRNCAGFYQQLGEEIEGNLEEGGDGELLETKVALRLGRSVSELRRLGGDGEDAGKFAGKLF